MSQNYTPTEWVDNRTVGTASVMNNMEKGIEDAHDRIDGVDSQIKDIENKIDLLFLFGAKGDGITDDSDSIQNAIDYCVENNISELYIQNKIYYVTKSLQHKGIKIIGKHGSAGVFLTWDYTRPNSTDIDTKWRNYANRMKGSAIITDKDISIFSDGLKAKNIVLFGKRQNNSIGICDEFGDGRAKLDLEDVYILGFGKYGIYLPYGIINPTIKGGSVTQCGINGIKIGKEVGTYTGETNRLTIERCGITRNESHGIVADIQGRGVRIIDCSFENNGEVSDSTRPKPTSIDDLIFGCVINLYNTRALSNGSFVFESNYSEETYGLLKLNAINPSYGFSIKNNYWQPYSQDKFRRSLYLSGWIYGLTIEDNNFINSKNYKHIEFATNNYIKNVKIDDDYTGNIKEIPTLYTKLNGDKTMTRLQSTSYEVIAKFSSEFITGVRYEGKEDRTYLTINSNKTNGASWEGYDMEPDSTTNKHLGLGIIVGGNYFGCIYSISHANKVIVVNGNKSNVSIGDGSLSIIRLGGFTALNAGGTVCNVMIDNDCSLSFGNQKFLRNHKYMSGTSSTIPTSKSVIYNGFMYFNKDTNKPMWYNDGSWYYADGTKV